jgi:Uma2 family endonuclease
MRAIELRRWTREEYDRMAAAGVFAPGERVELIDGEILKMTPQGSAHFTAIRLAEEALHSAFGPGFEVRAQAPLALNAISESEPDVAVVRGFPRDYRDLHPVTALLVLEVSDTTLEYDRQRKGQLYACAGIQDYWLINIADHCVEVYQDPIEGSYCSMSHFQPGDVISPLAAPEAKIAVDDILP